MTRRKAKPKPKLPAPVLTWIAGAILTVVLAIFGYIVRLASDVSCLKAKAEVYDQQWHDTAELISKLVLKGGK